MERTRSTKKGGRKLASKEKRKQRNLSQEGDENIEYEDEEELEEVEEEEDLEDEENEENEEKSSAPMSSSSSLHQQIILHFGSNKTLYDLLNISSTATLSDIHRGYRLSALKYHPDKGGDPEKFKIISTIHNLLSNDDKRKYYDETGRIDEDEDSHEYHENENTYEYWSSYYRQLFPEITINDIIKYENIYKGSNDEKNDIWNAYVNSDGDLKQIMNVVMFAESGDEERIINIIDDGINNNIIQLTKKYQQIKKQILNKKKKFKKEASSSSTATSATTRMTPAGDGNDNGDDTLRNAILSKHSKSNKMNPFESIMSKYMDSSTNMNDYEIDDEAFQRTQQQLLNKTSGKKRKQEKKKK